MRWLAAILFLLQAVTLSPASVLHWTSRLMGMECDNRPAKAPSTPALQRRPAAPDLDTAQAFSAERPFSAGETVRLGVCAGEVHILPNPDSSTLKLTVQVAGPLPKDLTPKSYLQQFATDPQYATVGWKLPEAARPVLYLYVPQHTNIDLQLGKGDVDIADLAGNKDIHIGKGDARLNLGNGSDYGRVTIHVAMGSFDDQRPGGHQNHKVPLREEFHSAGPYTTDVHVAMGRAILLPSQ